MRPISKIIIHYTDSPDVSAATIRAWHKARGFVDIGYHKVVHRDGSVEAGRLEDQIGAHAKGYNTGSLGVVVTGSDREPWYPSEAQYNGLVAVIRDWTHRYGIAPVHIYFHREVNPTSCPGRLDKAKILRLLGAANIIEQPQPAPTPHRHTTRPPVPVTVRRGSKGDAVKLLQQRLHIHHANPGPIDGGFGPLTEAAVRRFQVARKIANDGVVGPITWGLLLSPAGR